MVNKDVTHPKMRRKIERPRIILLDCTLEYKKNESATSVRLHDSAAASDGRGRRPPAFGLPGSRARGLCCVARACWCWLRPCAWSLSVLQPIRGCGLSLAPWLHLGLARRPPPASSSSLHACPTATRLARRALARAQVELTDETQWEALLKQEEDWVGAVCQEILSHKPDVVVTEKGVSDLAQHFLVKVRPALPARGAAAEAEGRALPSRLRAASALAPRPSARAIRHRLWQADRALLPGPTAACAPPAPPPTHSALTRARHPPSRRPRPHVPLSLACAHRRPA